MKTSFRLSRINGIDIQIHHTFVLLPLFLGFYYYKNYGPGVGIRAISLILLVFICVLAHELTHSLMAKRLGVTVPKITLYPIGGVATMLSLPREPKKELLISVVGPLFNFALALILSAPLYFWLGPQVFFSPTLESWPGTISNFFWANLILGAFNLIPAFPMDGGRILRSFLAGRLTYSKATRISIYLGRIFAILFALLGFWTRHWVLILIAGFIYLSASEEERFSLEKTADD